MRVAPASLRVCAAVAATLGSAPAAFAANAEFQNFFFSVCAAPSGALATRCAQTPGGLGNLSGDSESSLNPSQSLARNVVPVSAAQTRSKAVRERGEKLRDEVPDADDGQSVRVDAGPFSLLVHAHGTSFDREATVTPVGERDFDGESFGGEIGLDYRVNDRVVVGALVGIEKASYEFAAEAPGVNFVPAVFAGDTDVDTTYLTAFASIGLGQRGFLDLSVGHERGDGTYRRRSVFQESTRAIAQTNVLVAGDADGRVNWASINVGMTFDRGTMNFGPYLGLTASQAKLDAFTEQDLSGSGLAMSYDEQKRDSLLAHAGLRAGWTISGRSGVWLPQVRVEYQHELENDAATSASRFALDTAGTAYRLAGYRPDDGFVNAGVSLAAALRNGWMPFLDVSVLLANDNFERRRVTLGLRKEF